jgi:hypothetical protein
MYAGGKGQIIRGAKANVEQPWRNYSEGSSVESICRMENSERADKRQYRRMAGRTSSDVDVVIEVETDSEKGVFPDSSGCVGATKQQVVSRDTAAEGDQKETQTYDTWPGGEPGPKLDDGKIRGDAGQRAPGHAVAPVGHVADSSTSGECGRDKVGQCKYGKLRMELYMDRAQDKPHHWNETVHGHYSSECAKDSDRTLSGSTKSRACDIESDDDESGRPFQERKNQVPHDATVGSTMVEAARFERPTTHEDKSAPNRVDTSGVPGEHTNEEWRRRVRRRELKQAFNVQGLSGSSLKQRINITHGKGPTADVWETTETPDWTLPLYTPKVKKISVDEITQLLGVDDDDLKWLNDEEHYTALMRAIPMKNRLRPRNIIPAKDELQLVEAGIIEPADERESKAWCRVTSTNERHKGRRRPLVEPRDINNRTKATGVPKVNLPSSRQIQRLVALHNYVESIDFKSYFYQICLAPEIRNFFRIQLNGKLYQLAVMPMGACFSVALAQKISTAMAKKVYGQLPSDELAIYVDNVFRFSNSKIEKSNGWMADVGSHEVSDDLEILGQKVNLKTKTIDCGQKTRMKLTQLDRRAKTHLELWQTMGVLMYVAEIKHRSMAKYYFLMRTLGKSCSDFLAGRVSKHDEILWEKVAFHQLGELIAEAKDWPPAKVNGGWTANTHQQDKGSVIIFTDASDWGYGIVSLGDEGWTIHSGEWDPEMKNTPIHEREAEAIIIAISKVQEQCRKVFILCDNTVVVQCLRKGRSRSVKLNKTVAKTLTIECEIYVTWVSTGQQIADKPSRNEQLSQNDVVHAWNELHDMKVERIWWDKMWIDS